MYCKHSNISAVLINRLNHKIFLRFDVFGHSLCWSEKIFCLEDVGILHSAMHFEKLTRLRQSGCSVASVKGCGGRGGGGGG